MSFINKTSLGITVLIIGMLSGALFINKQKVDIKKDYLVELSDYNIEIIKMQNHEKSTGDTTFTDAELNNMKYVDDKIQDLLQNKKYGKLSLDDRKDVMKALLDELEKNGYIKNISYNQDEIFSFSYYNGVFGGAMIKERDPMLN